MTNRAPFKLRFPLLIAGLVFPALALVPETAEAQNIYTWDGGGTAIQGWGNSNHWVGSPALTFDENTTAIFNAVGAGNLLNGFGVDRTIGHLIFNENADSPVRIQFTVHATNLAARNLIMGGPSVAPTITVDAGAGAAHEMGLQGGNLILANNLTVQHNGSHTLTISQPINDGGAAHSLTKEGVGTLILSGATNYGGGTVINEGLLIYSNTGANSLGAATGGVEVNSTLRFNNTGTDNFVVANPITGSGTIEVSSNAAPAAPNFRRTEIRGLSGFTGDIRVLENGNYVLWDTSGSAAVEVNLPDTTITVESGGFLSVLGTAATPTTTIGTLNGSGTVTKNVGPTNHAHLVIAEGGDFSGVISETALNGGATLRLTMDGNGTLILSGANTYTGPTFVNAGILQINGGTGQGRLGQGDNSDTTIAAGAVLRINRSGGGNDAMRYGGTLSGEGTVEILAARRMDFTANQLDSDNLSFVVNGILAARSGPAVTTVHLGELSGSGVLQRGGTPPLGASTTFVIGGKNTDSTFSGRIFTPEIGIEKVGTGTLVLTGPNNDYWGTTVVSGGTLVINGALVNTSSVTVGSGATLAGAGSITTTGNSTVIETGGTIAPGDPTMVTGTGTLSLNTSSLTFDTGSFWAVNIAGADHGRLQLDSTASSLDLSGVSLAAGSTSFSPQTNTPYWILDNVGDTSLSGMFANMTLDGVGANLFPEAPTGFVDLGGTPFAVFLNADFGGNSMFSGGNDILLFAIPEPSKTMLLAIALLGLLARRRRS